ncbi:MAG: DUF4040 family protein [Propionibacteriaceae bacterium]|nr:DUF4040 family protein [Propionibacteriaceae bacterium]
MSMVWTLAVLAVAVVLTPVLDRLLGRNAGWPLVGLYAVATAVFWPTASEVLAGREVAVSIPWIESLGVDLALRADGLGVVFGLIALVIGAVVFTYSTRYLERGRQLSFYLLMTAFTLAMLGLVLADDLVVLFICWEFTSLASFFLIARSGQGGQAASMRTLLLTFVGGLALLVAVALIIVRTGTTSVSAALAAPTWSGDPAFTALVAVLVAVAGFSKSAQFPFHVWLPDAMAAATPVSAYLHAAAVVKAGIFVLMRFSPAFHATPAWNVMLLVVGLSTAALGAWFALQQTDLKRLMAYSTVSQLGLIVAAVGVGTTVALAAAITHTIAHALFKSGLFMMVGVVDHAAHTRDVRRLPALWRELPGSFAVMAVGCASMAGLPPLLGFISKESLFTGLLDAPGPAWAGWLAMGAAAAASVLTFAYCGKILFGAFLDGRGEDPTDTREIHRPGPVLLGAAALPILAGLPLGLAAGVLDLPVTGATRAMRPGVEHDAHLSLWHGPTPELVATLAVFTLGILILTQRRALWPRLEAHRFPVDGATVIAGLHRALRRAGRPLVDLFVVDRPDRHLAWLLAAYIAVVIPGLAAVAPLTPAWAQGPVGLIAPIDVVVLVLITAAVVSVCRARSRLAAAVSLSAVGIVATVQILALGAPDVALTQLLVESLTIIVIMLVLQKLPLDFGESTKRRTGIALALAGGMGLAAGAATWFLSARRPRSPVSDYYATQATEVTSGNNIVNVILVEFRALDTLGELAVLGMAGIAIVALVSSVRHRLLDPTPQEKRVPVPEPVLDLREEGTAAHRAITSAWSNVLPMQLVLRFMTPVLAVLSAVIFWRGHNEPGGGFIAALVGSAIVGLIYLSTSKDRQIGPPRLPVVLIGSGITVAVVTGLVGLAFGSSFLEPLHGYLGGVHLVTSMLFDVGVYLAVIGLITLAFNLLGTGGDTLTRAGGEGIRERADEAVEGELPGPLDTVRGEPAPAGRVGLRTRYLSEGTPPKELGR